MKAIYEYYKKTRDKGVNNHYNSYIGGINILNNFGEHYYSWSIEDLINAYEQGKKDWEKWEKYSSWLWKKDSNKYNEFKKKYSATEIIRRRDESKTNEL